MVKISSKAKKLITLLNQSGYEAYLVGGCVRDLIMGEEPHDWDICTQAKPDEIIKVLKNNKIKFNTVGIEFGTVVAMMDSNEFEITTFRKETGYSDGRHPDKVEYADTIEGDLARRDFTINAIAMATDCKSGIKLIDPYGGVSDIRNKRLRCVGNAVDRFNEDSLRILRALRFSIKYDLLIDVQVSRSIYKCLDSLNNLSKERVTDEFKKILTCGKPVKDYFVRFADVIIALIPELESCVGFNQNNKYHRHNVYEHLLAVTDLCKTDKFEIKLAALLHDIGKPQAYVEDTQGQGHFYGHPDISGKICEELLIKDFRLTTKEKQLVLDLVYSHDTVVASKRKSVKRFLSKYNENFVRDWVVLVQADRDDHIIPDKNNIPKWTHPDEVLSIMNELLQEQQCFSLKDMRLNGKDLISLGLKQGKQIGYVLNTVFNEVLDETLENEHDKLIERARQLISEQ